MVKSNYNLSHGESQSFKHKKEANRGCVCALLREVAMHTGHSDLARTTTYCYPLVIPFPSKAKHKYVIPGI